MTMDKKEKVARAICAEKCAFMGEPPCYSVEGEWPNPNCSEPGCHAEAQAALAALEPVTVQEAAQILYNMPEEDRMRVWRATRDCPTGAEFGKWFCKGLRALAQKDAE